MITKNFKMIMQDILQLSYNVYGAYPVKDVNNNTRYTVQKTPAAIQNMEVATQLDQAGIHIGSGTTAATEDDYKLQAQITSGFSSSVVQSHEMDNDGNDVLNLDVTITNTGSSSITINEIGYVLDVMTSGSQGANVGTGSRKLMLDRTVFGTPVTIEVGGYETIRYSLKTTLPT